MPTVENLERLSGDNKDDYRRWEANEWSYSDQQLPGEYTKILYRNLVEAIEASNEPNLMSPSPEKWSFALAFIEILENVLKTVPDSIFESHGYQRQDIVFYTTMSDGDYMEEMMAESAKRFNTAETAQKILEYLKP